MTDTLYFSNQEPPESSEEHIENLLKQYNRRMQGLQEQRAALGIDTSPMILVEIQDIQNKIDELIKLRSEVQKRKVIATSPDDINNFTPIWSVLRSKVRYVDANLAYRFAETTDDTNILLGFTTLFLGAAISFAVNLAVSLGNPQISYEPVLQGTATAFCTLSTVVLGYLTIRSYGRAKRVREKLFNDDDRIKNSMISTTGVIEAE